MKMFLTRMGEGTRMVVAGDLSQVDLPTGARSGLRDALETLEGLPGIGVCRFDKRDVVRHPLVALSIGAVKAPPGEFPSHHEIAAAAAGAKKAAKRHEGSVLFIERRALQPHEVEEPQNAQDPGEPEAYS